MFILNYAKVTGIALVAHAVSHIVASTINPADPAVIQKSNKSQGRFDRNRYLQALRKSPRSSLTLPLCQIVN
jgi:hypothetical protein